MSRTPYMREIRADWRGQITGAVLDQRLARTIESADFLKRRPGLDAAAEVWPKAPVIVHAHDTGPLIRSNSGFWLAILLPATG